MGPTPVSLIPLLLAGLLAGCAVTPDGGPRGHLRLLQPLDIPPEAASLRLQYGRVVARNAVQEHDPFCIFEIDTRKEVAQGVAPGRFAITRVIRSVETFAGLPVMPLRPMRVAFHDDGSPTLLYFKTTFILTDAAQPVRSLACMSNQMAPGNPIQRHLSLAEIRQALGGLFSLELPGT
ncbi:MAG: hypothetical protein AB1899_12795 [Pseudomonadota bacterium]